MEPQVGRGLGRALVIPFPLGAGWGEIPGIAWTPLRRKARSLGGDRVDRECGLCQRGDGSLQPLGAVPRADP